MAVRSFTSQMEVDNARRLMKSGKLTSQQLNELAESIANYEDGIDATPYALKNEQFNAGRPAPVTPGAPTTGLYNDRQRAAAARGVDVDSALPYHVDFGAQFASNENELVDWYKKSLTKELGYETRLRPSQEFPGRYEYLKKDDKGKFRWTLTNGTLAGLGADVAINAPEIIGTFVGGTLGSAGGPIGMSGGANVLGALGAGVGEFAKQEIGKKLGLNQAVTSAQQRQDVLSAAKNSALWGVGSDLATGAFRFARYWFQGYSPLKKWDAIKLLENAEEGQKLADYLNQYASSGHKLDLSIPQKAVQSRINPATGMEEFVPTPIGKRALGLQQAVENSGGGRFDDPGLGVPLQEKNEESREALIRIYDNMATEVKSGQIPTTSAFEAGTPAVSAAREGYNEAKDLAKTEVEMEEAAIRDYFSTKFPDMPPVQLVSETRKAMQDYNQFWKETEGIAWNELWGRWFKGDDGRYRPILVPVDEEFAKYLRNDQGKKAYSFFKQASLLDASNLSGGKAGPGTIKGLNEADRSWISQFNPNIANDPQTQLIDIGALTESDIKGYRARMRRMVDQGQMSFAELKEFEVQLRSFRERAMQGLVDRDPRYADMQRDLGIAERTSRFRGELFDRGLARRFLKEARDQWSTQDLTAIGQMLQVKDEKAFDHFVSVINATPEAKQKLKETFFGLYMAKYTKDGMPTPALHERFMRDHGWALKKIYKEDELVQLRDMQSYATKLADSRTKLAKFDEIFNEKYGPVFGGKTAETISPEDIVDGIWTGSIKGEQLQAFENFVRARDAQFGTSSWGVYTDGVLNSLRAKITTNGKLNLAAMENILENRSYMMDVLYGRDFKENFNKVYQALKTVDQEVVRQSKAAAFESKVTEYGLRATIAPPMTREGRLLTLGSFLRGSAYRKNVTDIFVNPDALRRLAGFSEKMLTVQKWNNIFAKALAETGGLK